MLPALARCLSGSDIELALHESDVPTPTSTTRYHPAACRPENVHMLPQTVFHRVITAYAATMPQHVGSAGTLLLFSAAMATIILSYGGRQYESQCQCENVEILEHGIFQSWFRISIPIIRKAAFCSVR